MIVALLAGCAASNDTGGDRTRVINKTYDPALCTTLLPTTGSVALMENVNVSRPTQSDYFEKRYNRAMLEGVLDASGVETQTFVKALGIDLSKIPVTTGGCLFQHDLPEAQSRERGTWDYVSGGVDDGESRLDGLFVAYSPNDQVIMVREDSSRWTLVHEMMHANFYRQRSLDGAPQASALRQSVRDQLSLLKSSYSSYKANPNEADAAKIEDETFKTSNLLYKALVSSSLEEIADESLLLEEWSAGRLHNVSRVSVENAAWYIDYSRAQSLEDLSNFATTVTAFRDYIQQHAPANRTDSLFQSETSAAFQKSSDFIASVNTMTADLAQKAKTRAGLNGSPMVAGLNAGYVEMTNPHLAAMNNTPAMREFRKLNADLLN